MDSYTLWIFIILAVILLWCILSVVDIKELRTRVVALEAKHQISRDAIIQLDNRLKESDNKSKYKAKELTDEEKDELKIIVQEAMKMNPYKPNPCKTALQNTSAYIHCLRFYNQKLYTAPTGRIYKEVLRDMWFEETKGTCDCPSFSEWLKDRDIEFLESRR